VEELAESTPRREELLSTEAVRLAAEATGGPALWFLWGAASGQEIARIFPSPPAQVVGPISVSPPGQSIELDARLLERIAERWRETPRAVVPKRRRTPLGRRLDEIRRRIEASGQPLLSSWEEIDRELADRRGEPLDEPDR